MTETMMDDMFSTPEMDQEADDEMNRVLMEVAGVKLDGMKLTPVAQPTPKVSQQQNDLQSILDNV